MRSDAPRSSSCTPRSASVGEMCQSMRASPVRSSRVSVTVVAGSTVERWKFAVPPAEKPRQNGAHHSEAPGQGKPKTSFKPPWGHGSCIAISSAWASPRNLLKRQQYFRLFNIELLYYAIYLISL